MSYLQLELPPELIGVPFNVLKEFLSQFSKLLIGQIAPNVPDQLIQASVSDLLDTVGTAPAPVQVRLEFKHTCKHTGCTLDDCQLCRNNPSKVCGDNDCFDQQYWVRDDGKGGQLIKAKCGADVALQLIDKATNTPVYLPDVKIKLYVVNGQILAGSSPAEAPNGLYLSDDGHPLFAAAGSALEDDKGVPMELSPDERLGPVAHIPEFQFLNKNSKFKVGGRTFKCFKLLARATKRDPTTGQEVVLSQVESESFKVTTKKGYDGCRKAEYLYAHDPITDKTFANLGETTISNLKASFDGVETVEDLMQLVQACRSQPDMEQRLREVLNMARDVEKWRNLTRMLNDKVVWDDNIPRIFVVPNGGRPLGLLFRANKAQVDFSNPVGVLLRPPAATGQLRVTKLSDRLQTHASRQLDALRSIAMGYWKISRHPGWALAPESPCWEDAAASDVVETFTELFGPGDPATVAELHVAAYTQMAAAAAAAASPYLQRSPCHPAISVTPPPGGIISPTGTVSLPQGLATAQGSINPAAAAGIGVWGTGSGLPVTVTPEDIAAAAAATNGSGANGLAHMTISGGTIPSPGVGRGVSGGYDSGDSRDNLAAAVAAAAAGFGRLGAPSGVQHHVSLPAQMGRSNVVSTSGQLAATCSAPSASGGSGLSLPTLLNPTQVGVGVPNQGFASQQQQQQGTMQGAGSGPSPFAVPGLVRGSSGGGSGDATALSAGLSAGLNMGPPQQQQQQHMAMGMYAAGRGLGPAGMAGYQPGSAAGMQQSSGMAAALGSSGAAAAAAAAMQVQLQMQGAGAYQAAAQMPGSYGQQQLMALQQQLVQQQQQQPHMAQQQQQPPMTQQHQQQFAGGQVTPGAASPMTRAARTTSGGPDGHVSSSGTPSGPVNTQQQQQQQQLLQQTQSVNTMLLQRAIIEGWPAPQVKAVLDRMSDEELRALVAQQPVTAAGVLARATGAYGQQQQQHQGLAVISENPVLQGVHDGILGHSQQMHTPAAAAAAAAGVGYGAAVPVPAVTQAASRQQQQQQQLQQQQSSGTGAAAAAALAALFADTAGGAAAAAALGNGKGSFDVQVMLDQQSSLNLGLDSFSDQGQWGDLLENLRALSSSSGPKGENGGNSMLSTDWIPDLIFRLESESQKAKESGIAAAAAAGGEVPAAADASGPLPAAAAVSDMPAAAVQQAVAAAAAAAAAVGADEDRGPGRKAKRERSKTGQAPSAEQLAQLQALVSQDPSMLRSLSKGHSHYGSFNRHFPLARTSSRVESVAQGSQVSNPWQPGLSLADAGVPTSPDRQQQQQSSLAPAAAAANVTESTAVATHTHVVTALNTQMATAGAHTAAAATAAAAIGGEHALCERITEEGAAAVAAVTGLDQPLPPVVGPNGDPLAENPSTELLHVLGLLQEEGSLQGYNSAPLDALGGTTAAAAAAADGVAVEDALVNHASASGTAVAAVDLATPFEMSQPSAVDAAAAAFMQQPHRTNSGRTGWISSLFRSGSSRSSKNSGSLKGSSSVPVGSGGSHSSRDAPASAVAHTGSS